MLHWDLLAAAWPIMLTGYAGIFVVTLVIIGIVSLLGKLGTKKVRIFPQGRVAQCPK